MALADQSPGRVRFDEVLAPAPAAQPRDVVGCDRPAPPLGRALDRVATPGGSPSRAASGGATVLLVDDEPAIRRLIVRLLQRLGYAVIEAGDGEAALSLIEAAGRIDLLLTDLGLTPTMNGLQLASAARALRPELKVAFITGSGDSALVNGICAAGDMAVITKPFEMTALARKVGSLIAGPCTP